MKKIIICIVVTVMTLLLMFTGVIDSVDKTVEDKLYHKPEKINNKIRIIKIDDKTMNELGDLYEWDRDIYAKLVDKLCVSDEVHPAVIGFDVLFSSDKTEEGDAAFAKACRKYNNVVTGFSYVFEKDVVTDKDGNVIQNSMKVAEKVEAYDELKDATNAGFVNALMDEDDSVIRSSFVYFDEEDGTRTKSFSAKIYEEYMKKCGKKVEFATKDDVMRFRYSGGIYDYENVSMIDVLDGTIPADAFDDCIVLVGAYAPGMMDAYFVPVDRGQQMYGVEIHANVIQAHMDGKTLKSIPKWIDLMVALVITITLIVICDKLSVTKSIILCITIIVVKLVTGWILFNNGYTGDNLTLPIMVVVIAAYYILIKYYKAKVVKKSIESAFSKYVAPQVVSEIAKGGTYELTIGGENRNIAVLFVDIRGFTPLSESLSPQDVVGILNEYLEHTTSCIFKHGGTLDKFIGDAAMAVFNAPFDMDDYVYKAVLAAWDIVQGADKIREKLLQKYGKRVGFGVGVNCGPAVVGNIGCDFRMDYTAIGDTVNTAARLEANAQEGKVYISDIVYEKIKNRVMVEEVGEIPLKGKSKGVFVYSVTGIKN